MTNFNVGFTTHYNCNALNLIIVNFSSNDKVLLANYDNNYVICY